MSLPFQLLLRIGFFPFLQLLPEFLPLGIRFQLLIPTLYKKKNHIRLRFHIPIAMYLLGCRQDHIVNDTKRLTCSRHNSISMLLKHEFKNIRMAVNSLKYWGLRSPVSCKQISMIWWKNPENCSWFEVSKMCHPEMRSRVFSFIINTIDRAWARVAWPAT